MMREKYGFMLVSVDNRRDDEQQNEQYESNIYLMRKITFYRNQLNFIKYQKKESLEETE